MKKLKGLLITTIMVLAFTMLGLSHEAFASPLAATAPSLGAAGDYSVLGALSASSSQIQPPSLANLGLAPVWKLVSPDPGWWVELTILVQQAQQPMPKAGL